MPSVPSFRPGIRPMAALLAVVLALAPLPTAPAEAGTSVEKLPNLQATPAKDISMVLSNGATLLRFTTFSWNGGTGPLELRAGTVETATSKQAVWQRVFYESTGYTDKFAGNFVWHPTHNHFHFEDYALYTLELTSGAGAATRTGQKTTFCVMDTNKVQGFSGGASTAGYTTCGDVKQGMSLGWGDMYSYSLPGQSLDMTGMPDGDYRLTIEVDPLNHLTESDRSDNLSCVLLRISVSARTVSVLNPNGCTVVTPVALTELNPSQLAVGQSAVAQIKGSGFVAGLAMSFVSGSGSAPTISGVTVVDASTATATISVRRKSKLGTDRTWDLRFGDATLPNALTVVP